MKNIGIALIGALALAAACENKDPAPTAADRETAANAQAEKDKAEAAKKDADKALADAKKKAEDAEKKLDAAEKKVDSAMDKLGSDWKGPARDTWHDSWTTFASGKEKTIDVGEWTLERGKDGEYTAWRKIKDTAKDSGSKLEDAAVLTAVKTKLAIDDDIKARNIDVDVKNNVVSLKGTVASAEQAGEAIRIALGTSGVEKVVSNLTWANRTM